jgi:hypothetical protein
MTSKIFFFMLLLNLNSNFVYCQKLKKMSQTSSVNFIIKNKQIYIPVKINNIECYLFFDTGASFTTIFLNQLDRLGITKKTGSMDVFDANNSIKSNEKVEIKKLAGFKYQRR